MKGKNGQPNLYVIAGPNGSGKTTFAREFLPHYAKCLDFVNADLIAGGLSPFDPTRAAIHAGRIMLEEIHSIGLSRKDFGFETTLSGKTYVELLRVMKEQGYRIHILFLWLPNVELALARIKGRVEEGGHDIPEATVRRRFQRSSFNFLKLYRPLSDVWAIFDNSPETPALVAFGESAKVTIVDRGKYAIVNEGKVGHEKRKGPERRSPRH